MHPSHSLVQLATEQASLSLMSFRVGSVLEPPRCKQRNEKGLQGL